MNTTAEELRERYADLNTDELLHIKISAQLTEKAKEMLEEELTSRNIDDTDYREVKEIHDTLEKEREETKKAVRQKLKRLAVFWAILLSISFGVLYLAYSWRTNL